VEEVALEESLGRILAADAAADRDYPEFNRSVRDGFAVRAADIPGRLRVIGEVRAGQRFEAVLKAGEAVEIMTGAPVPEGADAVVMIEHCTRLEDGGVETRQTGQPGMNIAHAACEARAESVVIPRGSRTDHAAIGWLATIGKSRVPVYARPRVAILATGDEIVAIDEKPARHQIRNSNSYSLAAQVRRAGGEPVILPVARDELEATADLIARGLETDLLLLSGGVSAGKYDFVEAALADCGAEFYFDRVLIQPGQPVVFGKARGKFFFGLPGNPASTMVTFELFGRGALELLGGASDAPLPLTLARLTRPFRHKPGLTRFLPATVNFSTAHNGPSDCGPGSSQTAHNGPSACALSCAEVTPVDWQGSGDIPSLVRANAFLVADPNQAEYAAGDLLPVLMK
jgi:molybdopterin molybdotransferase